MQFISGNGENNNRLTVMHRKGFPLAELRDPEDGGQISVVVHENEWTKQYSVPTHTRFFRNRMDAMRFIQKTFK